MAEATTLLEQACDSGIACLSEGKLWAAIAESLAASVGKTAEELLEDACNDGIACLDDRSLLVVAAQSLNTASLPCTITTTELPNGTDGTPYSQTIDANVPSAFALTAGALPDGLTLHADGTIDGTPTLANPYTFTVTATPTGDATPCSQEFSITIIPNEPPAFEPPQALSLMLWLKPESLSGLVDGDPVDTWPDSSGNANDFAAENSAFRPIYNTFQIGNQPALTFDGSDDFLKIGSALGVTNAWSIFVVLKFDTAVPATGQEWVFKNGEGTGWGIAKWNGNREGFYLNGTFQDDSGCTTDAEAWSYIRTSAPLAKLYVNGVNTAITNGTSAMGANPDATSRLGIFLNSTFPFDGKIAEVMLWNIALNDTDRQTVETYLLGKYGI